MSKVVFRPFRGDDREERLESDAVQSALMAALPGQILIAAEFQAVTPMRSAA